MGSQRGLGTESFLLSTQGRPDSDRQTDSLHVNAEMAVMCVCVYMYVVWPGVWCEPAEDSWQE